MSATGLDAFDKTLQITNRWLGEIMEALGSDRQVAWHALGAVLRAVRDRVPLGLAAHLGAQLPILVRGAYYDQWRPSEQPRNWRSLDEFVSIVSADMRNLKPVDTKDAARAVFGVLDRHLDPGQAGNVRDALPEEVRDLWITSGRASGIESAAERPARSRGTSSKEPAMTFELRSPSFEQNGQIPPKYTVDGQDASPPLVWSDPPAGTKSFVLILEDPDAPSGMFRHWGLYNITAGRDRLPEGVGHGVKTEDLGMGINDFGEPRYRGPAPPRGHGTHHYHFKLAALDVEVLTQAPTASVEDIWKAAQGHIIGEAELVGTYAR